MGRSSAELSGRAQLERVETPHHCIHPDISGVLGSLRMYIKHVIQVVGRVSVVITFVESLWLMAQNLKKVFSSYNMLTPLNDSEDGEVTLFPPSFGISALLI